MRIFPSNLIKGAKTTLCIQTIKKKQLEMKFHLS